MEQYSPRTQAQANIAMPSPSTTMQKPTGPDMLGSDALAIRQASSKHHGLEHTPSAAFPAKLATAPPVQLPPLAFSSFQSDSITELAPIQRPREKSTGSAGPTLPPLASVTGPQAHTPLPKPPDPSQSAASTKPATHWPSLNPFTTYYTPSYLDTAESSPSMASDRSVGHRGASVSLDDPDVRIAAEALGQMRTDCGSSPRDQSVSQASTPRDRKASRDFNTASPSPQSTDGQPTEPEPLLSLITTSHPLLATTIEGAASAYNNSKNYSPHLKTSAEYVESCLKPVGKAVGNVGRKAGVEGGVRWIFGRSRKQHSTTDIETGERGNSKRRKSDWSAKGLKALAAAHLDQGPDGEDRRMSVSTVDTLPAYDDTRSPAYSEVADNKGAPGQQWGQQFVVTTSGLGVAMKQESLKSLKYCVRVVKDTNGYISEVLVKLKNAIDEYDRASGTADGEDHGLAGHENPDRSNLIERMKELRDDLFRVIHGTVQTISKYAGSALPENARNLVHRQLMSLPGLYQFHYVRESEGRAENTSPDAWPRDSAHLALLFAKEALQMMTQVGDVLNRTLVSAEEWCDTLYRKKHEHLRSPLGTSKPLPALPVGAVDEDSSMSG